VFVFSQLLYASGGAIDLQAIRLQVLQGAGVTGTVNAGGNDANTGGTNATGNAGNARRDRRANKKTQ
jgi:hypothetical protein